MASRMARRILQINCGTIAARDVDSPDRHNAERDSRQDGENPRKGENCQDGENREGEENLDAPNSR